MLTVDNNPGSVAMFRDFATAYAAAKDGDTILFAGSDAPYSLGGIVITRRLHLVGTGYLLSENGIPGLSPKSAVIHEPTGRLTFGSVSNPQFATEISGEGSTITGLHLGSPLVTSVSITLDRCRTLGVEDNMDFPGRITVRRCLMTGVLRLRQPGSRVQNSFLGNSEFRAGTTIANCVIGIDQANGGMGSEEAVSFSNSILLSSSGAAPTPTQFAGQNKASFTHCMAIGGSFLPPGAGNINGIPFRGDAFLAAGSPEVDAYWQLKPGSPALGAGFNGVDMGAFGGSTPYILSGVPSRPRLTRFVVPAAVTSTSGLRFEVDAQSF